MINKSMKDVKGLSQDKKPDLAVKPFKPNELNGIEVSTHLKISDPNTGKVLVQKRGDT
jgi:hypothetical protein